MSKTVTLKGLESWKGAVTFADPLYTEHALAVEQALDDMQVARPSAFLTNIRGGEMEINWSSSSDVPALRALCVCVEKWEIDGIAPDVTPETFPMSPRPKSTELISWLFGELMKIYWGAVDVPNE